MHSNNEMNQHSYLSLPLNLKYASLAKRTLKPRARMWRCGVVALWRVWLVSMTM
jgi:hypothetical protein